MKTRMLTSFVRYTLIALFVYTAFNKLFLYRIYVFDLERSPMIGSIAEPLSVALPAAEILIAGMLLFGKSRLYGFYAATVLMFLFTAYVGIMLLTEDSLPCTCGGLIRNLTWQQHLIFNISFTIAAAWAAGG